MGCLIRLLAAFVRSGVFLVLAGVGGFGCSTCLPGGPSPLRDTLSLRADGQRVDSSLRESDQGSRSASPTATPSDLLTRTGYHPPDAPAEKGLADSLGLPTPLPQTHPRTLNILGMSGGVAGAPFTAGVLVGWTQSGTRPVFDQVTGISSGSLIGAYAFLGPKYDPQMQNLILTISGADLFKFRPLSCMLCDGAFGSSKPAERLIRRAFDGCYMNDLRQAHAEGRRFYVGTMNLETRRLTIWDIGAIASSGRPDADDLVRKVLLAAVSWPGAVPPVVFDMEIEGHCYHEEHCDAGAVAMVMPPLGPQTAYLSGSNIYVLASRKLYSEPACVRKSAFCRIKPCMMAFFETLTRENISRVYSVCMLTGACFHMLAVPQDYHGEAPNLTHLYPKDAPRLFETGYQMGVKGPHWRHTPPGAEPGEEPIPHDATGIQLCH